MDQEIKTIEKKDTWELTDLPSRSKKIGVKWIYHIDIPNKQITSSIFFFFLQNNIKIVTKNRKIKSYGLHSFKMHKNSLANHNISKISDIDSPMC